MAHRIERINSLIRREISDLLQHEVRDPRFSSFVSVTEVCTTPDLKFAKIFISRLGSEEEKQETMKALASASRFFHNELFKRLRLRRIPELSFHWDDSIERGERLLCLIEQVSGDSNPGVDSERDS